MGVAVDKEWRFRRVSSEQASKSAFTFKVNKKLKYQGQKPSVFSPKASYSQEVVVKITGGAKSKKGCLESIKYISHNWQDGLMDSNGIQYDTKEDMLDATQILQEQADLLKSSKAVKLTHNITFSAPKIAGVKKEDLLTSVSKALQTKYPENYFLMAYHDNAANPHVHVALSINTWEDKRIDIRKNDLRALREGFCNALTKFGYQVKATRKWRDDYQEYQNLLTNNNRNIYRVVDFGSSAYQLDKNNSKCNYLRYRLPGSSREVTIWGKGLLEEIQRNKVKIGDLIKLKRIGKMEIKVPVYDKIATNIIAWKSVKRNQWQIENTSLDSLQLTPRDLDTNSLNSLTNNSNPLENKHKFGYEKELLLHGKNQDKHSLQPKYQYKYKIS